MNKFLFKKILGFSFILVFSFCSCFLGAKADEPIQAGVKYNEASARIEAFSNVQRKIEKDKFKEEFSRYLKDENKKENIASIKEKNFEIVFKDKYLKNEENTRFLCPFYLDDTLITYAIIYKDKIRYAFYYNVFGSLMKIDIREDLSKDYPKKILSYSRTGKLIGVTFEASDKEQFVYSEKGKLIAHWEDKKMYDKENNIPKFLKIQRGALEKAEK